MPKPLRRVAATIHTTDQACVRGKQPVFTCTGRKLEPGPVLREKYSREDSDPVSIRLSLLVIPDISLAGASGEVMTMIGEHLKRQSPLSQMVVVTHANGSSGYIPDDAEFEQVSHEMTTSPLSPGCAENEIVNGFLKLMEPR